VFTSVHASAVAQLPAADPHPDTVSQVAVQHTFVGPTAQVVEVAVQVHVLHAPAPLQ
jgi:hypothetical protein